MSKYFVTYVVVGTEAGFNVFGHSFLLLSEQKVENGPIEIIDAIGFYSQPSTTTRPSHKRVKALLGIPMDLQDGHGELKQEEMRYLDGNGLQGLSFEVSEEQFQRINVLYKTQMDNEKKAILELNKQLETAESNRLKASYSQSDLTNSLTLKKLENESKLAANGFTRYQLEIQNNPNPRLQRFHVAMEVTARGWFDSRNSHNCKHMALELLIAAEIIDKAKALSIIGNKAGAGFPRASQLVEPLRLVSTGATILDESEKAKKANKIYYNRTWENKNPLFWATKPVLDHASSKALAENTTAYEQTKSILTKTREIEKTLNAELHNRGNIPSLLVQLENVQGIYELMRYSKEPTLIKKNFELLEKLINEGYSKNISLLLNSNLTNDKTTFFDLISQFKNVTFFASVDGYGPVQEYLRYPSNWEQIDKNINKLVDRQADNIKLQIVPVVQIGNIGNITELFEYAESFNRNAEKLVVEIFLNILEYPLYLNLLYLPIEYKIKCWEKIDNWVKNSCKYQPELFHSQLETLKNKCFSNTDYQKTLNTFFEFNELLDTIQHDKLININPELYSLMNK